MNRDCEEGLRLRHRLENELRRWGWFEACKKAVEIMPLGHEKIQEFQNQAWEAESKARKSCSALAEHMAQCIVCSRSLINPDAMSIIQAKLEKAASGFS